MPSVATPPPPSRAELLVRIANAAHFGSLGFFVGTGFSRALARGAAPTFRELLERVAKALSISFDFNDADAVRGKSFPQLADELVTALAQARSVSYEQSAAEFKQEISRQCNLRPDPREAQAYRDAIARIPIQWVITTNYDFSLEDVVPRSICLLPSQMLNVRSDYVPIYHLHGHRNAPDSIVVTETDYVRLFSPTEYRQLKLNLLLPESTTVMMGYSLGDINVKNALEWSRAFKDNWGLRAEHYQSLVVQVLYVAGTPKPHPYVGLSGEVIVETTNLLDFLHEIGEAVELRRVDHEASRRLLEEWLSGTHAAAVADNADARGQFLATLVRFPRSYDVHTCIRFLDSVLEPVWSQARQDGGWEHYNRFLRVLLDIIKALHGDSMHPSLFAYLAEQLNLVGGYINPHSSNYSHGRSTAASVTWHTRRSELPVPLRRELYEFGRAHWRYGLVQLFEHDPDLK